MPSLNRRRERHILIYLVLLSIFTTGVIIAAIYSAAARDAGQWERSDPTVREWYRSLMQPDNPQVSCCGEADAYWADRFFVKDGKTFAVITDDRPDGPLNRHHVEVGTVIEIPDYKLKYDRGNPVGHPVVFLSYSNTVYCFVQGGGV
jgi:hypothetical protein